MDLNDCENKLKPKELSLNSKPTHATNQLNNEEDPCRKSKPTTATSQLNTDEDIFRNSKPTQLNNEEDTCRNSKLTHATNQPNYSRSKSMNASIRTFDPYNNFQLFGNDREKEADGQKGTFPGSRYSKWGDVIGTRGSSKPRNPQPCLIRSYANMSEKNNARKSRLPPKSVRDAHKLSCTGDKNCTQNNEAVFNQ